MTLNSSDAPLLDVCPEPTKCASYHPLLKHSRLRGSTVLKEQILARFSRKASGFLTTKDEANLVDLGLVAANSRFASATCSDFLIRSCQDE